MSSITWRYLSGDTSTFAIDLTLVNDGTDDWMVDAAERPSWGALTLWIDGLNVCEHTVQAETLQAAHWYLLPIVEWLVNQWDALLHEERLPLVNDEATAARGFQRAAMRAEVESSSSQNWQAAAATQAWEQRHSLRAAAPGALLPDLYIRRFGDDIEFSIGGATLPGEDWGVVFTGAGRTAQVTAERVASTLFDAVEMLLKHLQRSHPDHDRYHTLATALRELQEPAREARRVAWLSGAGEDLEAFHGLWQAVNDAIPASLQDGLTALVTPPPSTSSLVLLAPPAALLFGSLAPDISAEDVAHLYASLLGTTASAQVAATLAEHGSAVLRAWSDSGLTPGEQGSLYGEEAWLRLAYGNSPVDIHSVIKKLGIGVDYVTLSDSSIRAVSMIGPNGSAHIVVNRSFRLGISPPVERFTLAHELGHLLLDQDRATRMVVASGPWAPKTIEQRASAFAAAFLVPVPLLDNHLARLPDWNQSPEQIRRTARTLEVSYSALVSRLQNLSRVTSEEADILREQIELP